MNNHKNLLTVPGYRLAACFSRDKNRGGACILVKAGYEYKELPDITKHSVSRVVECCAIELTLLKIIVICMYRIPNFNNLDIFYEKLDKIL